MTSGRGTVIEMNLPLTKKKKKSVKADVYSGDTKVDRLYIASQDLCSGFG